MKLGLVGRKCGMTRIFREDGSSIPVSVVVVEGNRVVRTKTVERDGYSAVQITTGAKKRSRLTRPEAGEFAKAGVEAGTGLWEFRVPEEALSQFTVGQDIGVDTFAEGQFVDVQGTTIGKGFAGVVKRHHFRTQDATHGNSLSHRAPGSIGQNQTPGRVFKGKKMAGHLGAATKTMQSLEIAAVDTAKSVLLIKGSIPGAKGGSVIVTPGTKK